MPFPDIADAALLGAILLFAGVVKGAVGFGLPTITLGLLALARPLPEAVALVVPVALATNLWQAFGGGALGAVLRRFWVFLLCASVAAFVAAGVLAQADARLLSGLLGVMLAASGGVALLGPDWPRPSPGWERLLQPVMGAASGGLTGLTGSFLMPAAPWLAALRLPSDHFVQVFGLGVLAATLPLGLTLAGGGLLPAETGLAGLLAVPPAFLGMEIGRRLRRRLPEARFRRLVQAGLALLGLYLAFRAFG